MTTTLRLLAACLSLAAASAMVCTDNTCATVRCAFVTAESCLGGTYVKNGGFCGCCDACIRSLNKGEHCLATLLMGVPSTARCGKGLYCDPRTSHCESLPDLTTLGKRETQTCAESKLTAQNGPHLLGAFVPECQTDGSYSAKQCRGSQCYCADPATGLPILNYMVNRWEATHMDCQCARDQAAYMKTGLIGKLFFCTDSGSYKTHQNNRAAAVSCAARVEQINAANTNGMPLLGQFIPQCEQDGTYSPRQCHGSVCYCTDSLGAKLGSYSGSIGSNMDCKCARDEAEYASSGLLGKSFRCDEAGSYQRYACTGSVCYCADSTGQMKPGSPQVNIGNIGDLSC